MLNCISKRLDLVYSKDVSKDWGISSIIYSFASVKILNNGFHYPNNWLGEEAMIRLKAIFTSNKGRWWDDHKQTLWRDIRWNKGSACRRRCLLELNVSLMMAGVVVRFLSEDELWDKQSAAVSCSVDSFL